MHFALITGAIALVVVQQRVTADDRVQYRYDGKKLQIAKGTNNDPNMSLQMCPIVINSAAGQQLKIVQTTQTQNQCNTPQTVSAQGKIDPFQNYQSSNQYHGVVITTLNGLNPYRDDLMIKEGTDSEDFAEDLVRIMDHRLTNLSAGTYRLQIWAKPEDRVFSNLQVKFRLDCHDGNSRPLPPLIEMKDYMDRNEIANFSISFPIATIVECYQTCAEVIPKVSDVPNGPPVRLYRAGSICFPITDGAFQATTLATLSLFIIALTTIHSFTVVAS